MTLPFLFFSCFLSVSISKYKFPEGSEPFCPQGLNKLSVQ